MKPAKVDIAAQSMSLDVLERNVEEGEGKNNYFNILT